MKKIIFIGLLLVVLIPLWAFPFGSYEGIRVPDATVMPHKMARLTFASYIVPDSNLKGDDYSYNWGGAVNIGLFDYAELGLVGTGDEVYFGHLKLRVFRESLAMPDIAIGIDNLFSKVTADNYRSNRFRNEIVDSANYRSNSMYLVVSKSTMIREVGTIGNLPVRITLGAGTHRFVGTVPTSRKATGIFGSFILDPIPNMSVISEIDGHNFNFGLGYRYQNFSGKAIAYKIEEWDRRDPKFGFTLSYLFDKYATATERSDTVAPVRIIDRQPTGAREGATLDELQRIRRQRERAEKELEEIRRLLED